MPKRHHSEEEEEHYNQLKKKYKKAKKLRKRHRRTRRHSETENRTPSPSLPPSDDNFLEMLPSSRGSSRPNTPLMELTETSNTTMPNPSVPPANLCKEAAAENVVVCDLTEPGPSQTTENEELDSDILQILGEDPTVIATYSRPIQKELAVRFQHIATAGLSKEERKEILEKYLVPENAKLIDAPLLNPEMKIPSCLSDNIIKRDKAIYHKQKQLASAISGIGEAITHIIVSKHKDPTLIKILMDTGRSLCDLQCAESLTRRNYALTSLKKDIKDQLKSTKIDSHLFGENLQDTLKSAKTINSNAAFLKDNTPKPIKNKTFYNSATYKTQQSLNQKGPFPVRRQPGPPRTTQPQPAHSQRNQPSSSSRQYRPPQPPPQQPYRRNYRR